MSFIPEQQLQHSNTINFAPMIDFLFLMLMFFACLAVSKSHLNNTTIELVETDASTQATLDEASIDHKIVNLNINKQGEYFWETETKSYLIASPEEIANELNIQHKNGLLPEDRLKTQILVKIDKQTTWDPILKLIFAVRNAGFEIYPVYLPESNPEIM